MLCTICDNKVNVIAQCIMSAHFNYFLKILTWVDHFLVAGILGTIPSSHALYFTLVNCSNYSVQATMIEKKLRM